jgi:hypothetical protein
MFFGSGKSLQSQWCPPLARTQNPPITRSPGHQCSGCGLSLRIVPGDKFAWIPLDLGRTRRPSDRNDEHSHCRTLWRSAIPRPSWLGSSRFVVSSGCVVHRIVRERLCRRVIACLESHDPGEERWASLSFLAHWPCWPQANSPRKVRLGILSSERILRFSKHIPGDRTKYDAAAAITMGQVPLRRLKQHTAQLEYL